MKNIFSIPLILAVVIPFYGFQQWYIMTYGSINSMNIYLLLFLFSIALRNSKSSTNLEPC